MMRSTNGRRAAARRIGTFGLLAGLGGSATPAWAAPTAALLEPAGVPGAPRVTGTSVRVHATCTGDGAAACTSLKVEAFDTQLPGAPPQLLAVGGPVDLDQTVSLAGVDLTRARLVVTATDAGGGSHVVERELFVTSSVHVERVTAVPGRVLDLDATRVLYTDGAQLLARNRTTGVDTLLAPAASPARAWLTAAGAVWEGYESRFGTVTALPGSDVIVRGKWALMRNASSMLREDLDTGTVIPVFPIQQARFIAYDLRDDGNMVWAERDGSNRPVIQTGRDIGGARPWVFDVWARGDYVPSAIRLGSGAGLGTVMLGASVDGRVARSVNRAAFGLVTTTFAGDTGIGAAFATAGTWSAHVTAGGPVAVVTPAGATELTSDLPGAHRLAALAPSGAVLVDVPSAGRQARYAAASGGAAPAPSWVVGPPEGEARWLDGAWHVLLGDSVLRVSANAGGLPNAPPGPGPVDAGPDAAEGGVVVDAGAPPDAAPEEDAGEGLADASVEAGDGGEAGTATDAAPGTSSGGAGSDAGTAGGSDDDGGCSQGGRGGSAWFGLLAVAGLLARRRRAREG